MSKPHYKTEAASRPESKSTTKTKVAEVAPPIIEQAAPPEVTCAATKETCAATPICQEELRTRAFLKWESDGRPEGDGVAYWLAAEQELQGSN